MEHEVNRRGFLKTAAAAGAVLAAGNVLLPGTPKQALAEQAKQITLAKPQTDGGNAFLQLLMKRSSSRDFGPEPLPLDMLSNLLWAAFGINRPASGHRTAPSARNWQETDIYVTLAEGAYLYDPKANALNEVARADLRELTGLQPFVREAPLNLVYVADYTKIDTKKSEEKDIFSFASAGFIGQNVYLFCASAGLITVVRASIDRPALAKALNLRPDQKITLAQTVGFPKKKT